MATVRAATIPGSVSSSAGTVISLRPKPAMSRQDTWAPMVTPAAIAPAHACRIVSGSPAWQPQAMLALLTSDSSA
jgi:hypothetical protein